MSKKYKTKFQYPHDYEDLEEDNLDILKDLDKLTDESTIGDLKKVFENNGKDLEVILQTGDSYTHNLNLTANTLQQVDWYMVIEWLIEKDKK